MTPKDRAEAFCREMTAWENEWFPRMTDPASWAVFTSPVKDRAGLAERIYAFCPDFVDQGIGLTEEGEPHELIERYLESNRDFFFWWD